MTGARERAGVLLAAALVGWFRLRLRLPQALGRGRRLLRRELGQPVAPRAQGSAAPAAGRLERLFARGLRTRLGRGAGCLPRSLALARFLRLHGLEARVCLGFSRRAGRLAGHAWVEHDCAVVCDQPAFVAGFSRVRSVAPGGLRA